MAKGDAGRLRRIETASVREAALLGAIAAAAFAPAVLRVGWTVDERVIGVGLLHGAQVVMLAVYGAALAWTARGELSGGVRGFVRRFPFESALLAVAAALAWWWPAVALVSALLLLRQMLRGFAVVVQATASPGLIFVGTYLTIIAMGAAALRLPAATPPDKPIDTIDAFFTSTSAVCITGLVVRDTSSEFTRFGQSVILVLMQLGGLGIVLFGALLALMLGSAFGLRATRTLVDTASTGGASPAMVRRLVVFIVAATFAMEAIGAALLFFGWPATWEGAPAMESAGDRLFHSVFFAVSAYCNAGFATAPNSLAGLRTHWTTHIVMAGLITIGGLGFPVFENFREIVWARVRRVRKGASGLVRLNLHTKLTLTTTTLVYLSGVTIVFLGGVLHTTDPVLVNLLDAHFMSITARTAGFDSIPPARMDPMGQFALMIFMFIGGSPGSMAGGVKTIVLAVLVMTVWATVTGRTETQAFGRTISQEIVRKAATLLTLGFLTVVSVTCVLATTDGAKHALIDLMFEAVSACSTVGLSMGVTGELSDPGRVAIMAGMFLGRLGPLALLVTIVNVARRHRARWEYPTEGVLIS